MKCRQRCVWPELLSNEICIIWVVEAVLQVEGTM